MLGSLATKYTLKIVILVLSEIQTFRKNSIKYYKRWNMILSYVKRLQTGIWFDYSLVNVKTKKGKYKYIWNM